MDEDEKLDEQTAGAFGIASFYLMQSLMSALVEKDLFTMREIALIATAAAKNADDAVPTSPVPWNYHRNGRRERLEMIPPTMSTPPAAMPTRAAPSSNAIPAKARIPMTRTKRAMPTGPSRLIWMRALWCGPVDAQTRGARGQSAPGGMISGSVSGSV